MITEKSKQEILDHARVEEVVGDFVNLKRRGSNLLGLCPFHHEKTPSFTVSPIKGFFHCFGCGKSGDSVAFLMEHENLTFPEALKYLAQKYNIAVEETEVPDEIKQEKQHLDSLYIVNEFAKNFYQEQLFETDSGKSVGLSYFRQRGFREETIRKFGLGYAPDGNDIFTKTAIKAGHEIEFLKGLGLSTQYNRDFFRNRVIFPIFNLTGKVIAFAGRIMQKDAHTAKYMNSPETEIYSKSKVLYGANFARKSIRQLDECILVEGYTDVISLHQSGIENVVASSGTALTVDQIRLIKRNTQNIKMLFDGDPAGIKAAIRGLDMVLEEDMNIKIVLLPDGEDPDSYLQKEGVTRFNQYLNDTAKDFILFKANLLLAESAGDPVKKAGLIKDIVQSIAKIPDPIKRSLYVKECAHVMDVDEQVLVQETNKIVTRNITQKKTNTAESQSDQKSEGELYESPSRSEKNREMGVARPAETGHEYQEKDIARVLIVFGGAIVDTKENISLAHFVLGSIQDVLEGFDNPLFKQIVKESFQMLQNGQPLTTLYFLQHENKEIAGFAAQVLNAPYEYSENWDKMHDIHLQMQKMPDDNYREDSLQAIRRFKLHKLIKLCNENQIKIKQLNDSGETTLMMKHLKIQHKLLEMRNELAKQLNTVILK